MIVSRDIFSVRPIFTVYLWLDLMLWRRWRWCPRALAAQVSNSFSPAVSVLCESSSFHWCQVYSCTIFLDVVRPFVLGLSLVRDPSVRPNRAIYGNLSADIRDTWPKCDNRLIRRSSVISLSISKAFMMSTFVHLSRLVTPRIFLKTDISNTFSFRLRSSFSVHVSELYNRSDWTIRLVETNFCLLVYIVCIPNHL